MNDDANRIAGLSPEKLRLLLRRAKTRKKDEGTAPPHIVRQPRASGASVLSFAQQRLWMLDQFDDAQTSYNLSAAFRLKGVLKAPALDQSVNAIIARHEILRTVFRTTGEGAVQVISPPKSLPLRFRDIRQLPPVNRVAEVQRLASEEARRPFDLSEGPLLRVTLICLGDAEHVLLLTVHHIIFDAWSMNVFIREMCLLYDAFSAGRPSPLAEMPLQYADFAFWQRQRLKGELLESQLTYWKRQLGNTSAPLDLPLDRPRPNKQTFSGAHQNLSLPKSLAGALKTLGGSQGATLFVTLLAGFQTLMHRYTSQAEINVGIPAAGRDRVELENLIGFFVNTLVIRTSFADDPSFRELLARVRQTTMEALMHQDVPFEKLVEELQPKRDPSRPPLFQVMFQLRNFRAEVPSFMDLEATPIEVERGRAQFDLSIEMAEVPDGLVGTAEYNTDLFEDETIRRLLDHYRILLESAAADPGQRVSELRLLSELELRRQVCEWNATARAYEWGGGVAAEVERQAKQRGREVAVECGGRAMTYGELNRKANQLAHYFKRLGGGKEVRVGLYAERSIETCVALLGILRAGGTYVPLDPIYPRERLSLMMKDADPAVVLVGWRLDGSVLHGSAKVVSLEAAWDAIEQEEECEPPDDVTPEDSAYVIYTSGSEGTPKGVVGLHGGILNRIRWMQELYPIEENEICCQKTSLSFVDSIWEILGPLTSGARLLVIPDETVKDPGRLVQTLGEGRVSRIVLVPSLLRAILDTGDDLRQSLARLKYCLCSGESLPVELARRFRSAMPQCELINLYGSSEVAADATWEAVADGGAPTGIPIGRPIANTQAYVLDKHLQPLAVGVTGELHIGGHGLARGYLGLPELTATKFIPDPFTCQGGSRLFKTGDLARWLPDGRIEYVSRNDNQVKLRGFRVELGEVEAALEQHPSVEKSVVLIRHTPAGDKVLIAYILARPGCELSPAALRTSCRQKLPEYMIPTDFVFTESIPLTPNGKIDRRAVSEQTSVGPRTTSEADLPRTPIEKTLAEIWRKLLKIEQVGVHDDFFELGGHSLLATQVVMKVRDALRVALPLRAIFDARTIAALSEVITGGGCRLDGEEFDAVLKEVEELTADETHDAMLQDAEEP